MLTQTILVGLIVAGAAGWVAWRLLLPASIRARLRRCAGLAATRPAAGCSGCPGCGGGRRNRSEGVPYHMQKD